MTHALTRSRDCMITGLIAIAIVASLPLLGALAFALRPLLVVLAVVLIVATPLLCARNGRIRDWVDAQAGEEIDYRGLRLAPQFSFDPSHTWVRLNDAVVVGADDLVQAALGPIDEVELPNAGLHVSRGDRLFRLRGHGRTVDVRSPVSGTVVAANDELRHHPELINQRPFGRGWAVRLRAEGPDERRFLLRGSRARAWFRREVDRFVGMVMKQDGSAESADDDVQVEQLHERIDDTDWGRLQETMFARQAAEPEARS